MTPRAVIVGSGRSGSGYIAQVLRAARVVCGHEDWFNPWTVHIDGLDIESSWCALAIGLDGYQGRVFHQVRHPLDVVSSFAKQPPYDEYRALGNTLLPSEPTNPIEYGMATWVAYTEAGDDQAERTWRLEDVDAPLICELGEAVGVKVAKKRADTALQIVSRVYNQHGTGPRLWWTDLPRGVLFDRLCDVAARWW